MIHSKHILNTYVYTRSGRQMKLRIRDKRRK